MPALETTPEQRLMQKHTTGQGFWKDLVNVVDALECSTISHSPYIPKHMAFIMDGNRRYAKKMNLQTGDGHVDGFANMLRVLQCCYFMGVKCVSVYAFSIENFNRTPEEADLLFAMIRRNMWDEAHNGLVKENGWRIQFVGRRSLFEPDIREKIEKIEDLTKDGTNMLVYICAPYTTRDDICRAVVSTAHAFEDDVHLNGLHALECSRYIDADYPLDIMVRTSGATRFSDFMSWESDSNCLISFVPEYWPELGANRLYTIVLKWQKLYAQRIECEKHSLAAMSQAPPVLSVSQRKK